MKTKEKSRQQEIYTLLLTNKPPKQIAHDLNINYNTLLYHQKRLYRRLGIKSRVELFAMCMTSANQRTGGREQRARNREQ